jgi:hypothetical protein
MGKIRRRRNMVIITMTMMTNTTTTITVLQVVIIPQAHLTVLQVLTTLPVIQAITDQADQGSVRKKPNPSF